MSPRPCNCGKSKAATTPPAPVRPAGLIPKPTQEAKQ